MGNIMHHLFRVYMPYRLASPQLPVISDNGHMDVRHVIGLGSKQRLAGNIDARVVGNRTGG